MKPEFNPNEVFRFNRTLKHLKCTVWTQLTENQKQRFLTKELWPKMDNIAKDLNIEFDIFDQNGTLYLLVSKEDLLVGTYDTVENLKGCMRVFLNNVEKLELSVLDIEMCKNLLERLHTVYRKDVLRNEEVVTCLDPIPTIIYKKLLEYYIKHEESDKKYKEEPKTL